MLDNLFGIIKEDKLPLKHQIGRTIVAGIGAVVVSTVLEKGYDFWVKPTKKRK